MNGIALGEEQRFFPYFFQCFLRIFLSGVFLLLFLPLEAAAQRSEKEKLSLFDRLAEEATLLNQRGQYDQVIALLKPHQTDKKNDSALFYNELGVAYRYRGKYPEALQAYRQAYSRDPGNPVVMKNMGDAFYFQKEYSQAIDQYQQVLRSNPRFRQAHSGLGLAYFQLQKYGEALKEFEIVLTIDPKDEQAKKFREAILNKLKIKK